MTTPLILASKSASRRALLAGAGLSFEARGSGVDESLIKDEALARGDTPSAIALLLAEAKALAVEASDALVIGGDQVLEFEGRLYDKPTSLDEAAARFEQMAGKPHHLRNGLVLALNGEIVWRHQGSSTLWLRDLTRAEIDDYLTQCGEGVLATVGAYELEGLGSRLFDRLEGDYFSILGLPLLPLLAALRDRGVVPW